ncbi:MAG: HEAT repeat domain-containing protein [Promethearchaeota archaeon]
MLKTKLLPKEIFEKREILGLENSLVMLSEIIETDSDIHNRKDSIRFLGIISSKSSRLKKDCFKILENVLISDENREIRCETAIALGRIKYEKAIKPLKWLLEQHSITSDVRISVLKAIANIRFEDSEIRIFIKELDNENREVKDFIKNRLLNISPDILIDILLESLLNDDYSNQHKIEIIKLIGCEISSLNIAFKDTSYLKVNYPNIISELSKNKSNICEIITRNLNESDTELIESSIIILKILGNLINEDLFKLLEHDDFIVKKNAIKLIGELKLKEPRFISSLIKNLDNIYSEVSLASIKSLGEIGDISTVPDLLKVLDIEDIDFEYIDLDFKWYILDAVKQIFLNNKDNVSYDYLYSSLRSKNDVLKESVAYIMGELGKEEFVMPLIKLLDERNIEVKKNSIIALGKIGKIKALDKLIELLDSNYIYWLLKKVAVDAIYNIYNRNWKMNKANDNQIERIFIKNTEKLIDFLDNNLNECFKVKISLIKFLEAYGGKTALKTLLKLVNDFHRLVRISASNAIKKIEERLELEQ